MSRKALWSHIRALVIILAVLIGAWYWATHRQRDSSDVEAAKHVVEKIVSTPSSLKFFGGQLALSDAEWRLVTLEYDLQNDFGALIRHHDCVVFRWTSASQYEWNTQLAVQPCDVSVFGQVLIKMNRAALEKPSSEPQAN